MHSDKDKPFTPPVTDSGVAKDLARLYSWANVEEVAYQDFSQQRAERRMAAMRSAAARLPVVGSSDRDGSVETRMLTEGVPGLGEPEVLSASTRLTTPAESATVPATLRATLVSYASGESANNHSSFSHLSQIEDEVTARAPLQAEQLAPSQVAAVPHPEGPALRVTDASLNVAVPAHEPKIQSQRDWSTANPSAEFHGHSEPRTASWPVAAAGTTSSTISAVTRVFPQTSFSVSEWGAPRDQGLVDPSSSAARAAIAVYSIAGGVGRSTISAHLARALSSLDERVLLVDGSGLGLLPLYFGSNDLRAGLRTFRAPGDTRSAIQVSTADHASVDWFEKEIKPAMKGAERTIFDVSSGCEPLLDRMLSVCTVVLVPLLPDLNSILTLARVSGRLAQLETDRANPPQVFYVMNRFNEARPLDRQARELVERQCGDRLLPLSIRNSDEVMEALAARMTVGDLAPESELARDFVEMAKWLRRVSPPSLVGQQGRWSEL